MQHARWKIKKKNTDNVWKQVNKSMLFVREEVTTGKTTLRNDKLHNSHFSDITRLMKDEFKMCTSCWTDATKE